jgi:mannosyl-3-phosphoglycerate phosphatase
VRRQRQNLNSRLALVERRRLFVFTDLDGTLLDPVRYDWRAAASTLAYLRERNILLIPCTSKTRAEVEPLRRKMQHSGPYIAENGGVLVLPWKFLGRDSAQQPKPRELVLQLGASYEDVRRGLVKLSRLVRVSVRGFQEMTAEEVADATGLTRAQARRARLREASEPFRFLKASTAQIREFRRAARTWGFHVAEGARFWHLTMGTDKGKTMGLLLELADIMRGERALTIAAGDSSIDLPMLRQADVPILMPGRGGHFDPHLARALPRALRARANGPAGWADAIRRAIALCDQRDALPLKSRRPVATADVPRVLALREVFPAQAQTPQAKSRATRKRAASQ